jgi:UDP-GlcNAc:undecaprenyl-phosphate/decaprenyl-phosphate GlcNAc-1-phosphate transferase
MGAALLAAAVFLISLILAGTLTPLTGSLARRLNILDHPGKRKVHTLPTPRLGGVSVFIAFTSVVLTGYFFAPVLARLPWAKGLFGSALALLQEAYRVETKLLAVLAGGVLAFAVGLADDVLGRRFSPIVKAIGQTGAALILVAADVRTSFMPYAWMNVIVTIFWSVGITNAFNLLDNMDGLSAGVAFVASVVLLINAWSLGEFFISLILVAFMGSLLGFLFFNFHPASIFLGDCGSLFIGYLMGSLTILERYVSHASGTFFPVLMPVVVLAIPIVDTATVIVIRLKERRPIYVGDRRHLSHRLVSLGFSERAAVLFIYLASFCLGLGAASLTDANLLQALLIVLQSLGFVALLLILMFFDRTSDSRGAPQ